MRSRGSSPARSGFSASTPRSPCGARVTGSTWGIHVAEQVPLRRRRGWQARVAQAGLLGSIAC
eukprot:8446073-Lingulodinium_polyedra.AAC.1